MKPIRKLTLHPVDHRGINMVDLMMWLVIAALLLATALQSIGYYQKNANVYRMKTEVDVVASRVMAATSDRGTIDAALIDAVVAEENAARPNDDIIVSWGEGGVSASTAAPSSSGNEYGFELASAVTATAPSTAYFIKATNTAVKDSDVVYFLDDTASYSAGVHLIKKDALGAGTSAPEKTIPASGTCYVGQWKVSYIAAYNFTSNTPYTTRCENGDGIRYMWNLEGPQQLPAGTVDNYSVRWEKEITVTESKDYVFTARGDDYVKVYLDGVQVLYTVWSDSSGKTATVNIPAGTHKLKVEMTDGVSTGHITFNYAPAS